MYQRLQDVLTGREDNYMLPFYWQHGDHTGTIPEEVQRIYDSGCRALCVESRPHRDFCGEGWWRDMDIILEESEKRGMKVWILDDDHFPTGHAVGQVKNHPELRSWQLVERHVDVMGPLTDALLTMDNGNDEHVLLDVYAYPRVPSDESVCLEDCRPEPIRLTDGVSQRFLQFSLPEGCWRVFFLYQSRRGTNHPDYIDMLREESVKLLVDTVYEAHYEHYSKYFGSTIAGFFSDEPSLGNGWYGPHSNDYGMYNRRVGMPGLALPWNDRIICMMSEALGFDASRYLPALWFGLGEDTGRIRHAYMDAVTKLYRNCFTRQLGDWCEAHGVQYIGHIIEDMNAHARLGCSGGHYFRSLDGQHMSGIDIVLHQILPGMAHYIHNCSASGNNADPEFFDYVLGKLASSFAHIGTQTEGRAMCEVFGAYGWAEGTPAMKWLLDYLLVRGVNHFVPHAFSPAFPDPDCPPHFGANGADPQFEGFSKLMTYTNRAAHLLTGGVHHADAAILYHADAEWMNIDGGAMLTQVPAKILYDNHIDFDILPADCFVDGTDSRVYRAEVKDGKLRVGKESYQCLIVPAAVQLPEKLENALSALRESGVKVIRLGEDCAPAELLSTLDTFLERDITVDGSHPLLRCVHYTADRADVYMFVNESTSDRADTTVTLRGMEGHTSCIIADLLNDDTASAVVSDGRLALSLAPYQSVIAVFGHNMQCLAKKTWIPAGDADLTFTIETAPYTDLSNFTLYAENVKSDSLPNITDIRSQPDFSGRIRYTCKTRIPDGVTGLDLGTVGQTAHLWCSGVDLGVRVCPPYRYDLSGLAADAELVIEVSNTLGNAIRDRFTEYMAIPASGLIGGLTWLKNE
ncbi:MAG: glycosyl transferase family 2 [Clostridia bacterium]|nr:glycosyl transferase family 2 [Clostridia bacterium]